MAATATVGAAPPASGHAIGAHDRLFYGAMAVALGLTVFAGFART